MTTNALPNQHGKTWFITGASSGFGLLLAKYLVSIGANVVATARKVNSLTELEASAPAQVQAIALDVTSQSLIDEAVAAAIARWGHIDVLVNNAGYGLTGAVEEVTEDEYMPMFETNVFGLIKMTKSLLPQFRERRKGNIVFLSSIGGLTACPAGATTTQPSSPSKASVKRSPPSSSPSASTSPSSSPAPSAPNSSAPRAKLHKPSSLTTVRPPARSASTSTRSPASRLATRRRRSKPSSLPQPSRSRHCISSWANSPTTATSPRSDSFGKDIEAWKETTLGADFENQTAETPYK